MTASGTESEEFTLIRTKLQKPRLAGDLVPRRRLLGRLHAGSDRKLTLISAMAGTGKTTLMAQWLDESTLPSAWLSLDEHDNDRIVFLSYLCGALQTVFPSVCEEARSLLYAPQTPSARAITTLIVNELDELVVIPSQAGNRPQPGMILALDDYHTITEPAIHEIVSGLLEHLPQGVHLALATRSDPRLPLAGLRARRDMTEVRSVDLRFNSEEAHALLQETMGRELNPETVRLLETKTEGWAVGLRLAGLSMRSRLDDQAFVRRFEGTSSALIVEYLAGEVLARQSPEIREFVLRTSILDRFCPPLCETVTELPADKCQEIIEWITGANLFLSPLDEEGGWHRYHQLFADLLRHELARQTSASDISALHARAGAWFARHGLIDEALHHLLAANDRAAAVGLVAKHRYALMNGVQWPRLHRYLRRFSADTQDKYPDLLMLKAWLLYHRGRWAELPAALQRLEATLAQASLPPEQVRHLQGEMSALHSLLHYYALEPESSLAFAQEALDKTPRGLWIVRILARLFLAGVLQMRGDSAQAHAAIYRALEEEETQSNALKATTVMTVCWLHWLEANLQGMAQAARQCIALSKQASIPQILNYGHYHLGRVCYERNDLDAAEEHFRTIVRQPYLNYGNCFAYGACGLALVHQAQGRPDEARTVTESASMYMLEVGNTTLMPVVQAFQAELALMQGRIAVANQWAAHIDPVPPLTPMAELFSPHLTLVKIWIAQGTAESRQQAADLLDLTREFVESTHNTRFLIEVLALQALLADKQGDQGSALELLAQAIALAEPGGFVRLFLDLGPEMARLLAELHSRVVAAEYISKILSAFETTDDGLKAAAPAIRPSSPLVDPLTPRELEVLALLDRHLTNLEIAEELVVSPSTVKTHTLNIYRKLEVHGRKQAVAKARELDILPPR